MRRPERSGSLSTKSLRLKATVRPTPSCRPMTSSPTTRPGTRATSTSARPKRTRCFNTSTHGGPCRSVSSSRQKLGVNPYKFGMIGSTDSHTGLATAEEENFFGKHSGAEPSPKRWEHPMAQLGDKKYEGWSMVSSGYAAVWATENTREAIFDAMMRKETYATTGPRMLVRFFGGWDFTASDAQSRLPAAIGYTKGVPMGGDLRSAPAGKAPNFLVAALKDPYSGNLDRIQIVKGWVDASGERHRRSTMSPGPATASRAPTASCLRWATRWTLPTPPGPTPSALPS